MTDCAIRFEVPGKPVATNRAYRAGRGRFWMQPEAVEWKNLILAMSRRAMRGRGLFSGPVAVSVDLFFESARPDIDGPLKLILDAMQGAVYANDRQVSMVGLRRFKDPSRPRIAITVESAEHGKAT